MKTEEDIFLPLDCGAGILSVRRPRQLCQGPAIVLNLALDRARSLSSAPWCIASDVFLGAGHYSASFDLPCHGESLPQFGDELAGMAAAIEAGINVFERIRITAAAAAHMLIERQIVDEGRIFVCGTSRGGLAALHAMSASHQIAAAALIAPVTDLSRLNEFSHLKEVSLVKSSSADHLIPSLSNRPIYVEIGSTDDRVGTRECLEFYSRLAAASTERPPLLHIDSADGHRATDAAHQRAAAFLLRLAAHGTALQGRK